jgi:hypothetical protein
MANIACSIANATRTSCSNNVGIDEWKNCETPSLPSEQVYAFVTLAYDYQHYLL